MAEPVDVTGEDVQLRAIKQRIHDTGLDQGKYPVGVVEGPRFSNQNHDDDAAAYIEDHLVQPNDKYKISVVRGKSETHDEEGKLPIRHEVQLTARHLETDEQLKGEPLPGVVVAKRPDTDTDTVPEHKHGVSPARIEADEQLDDEPMPGVVMGSPQLPGVEVKAPSANVAAAPDASKAAKPAPGAKTPKA